MNLREDGFRSVITPQGELDLSNSWRIRTLAEDVISRSTNDIIVDLSSVCFIDSAAIQEVVRLWKTAGRLDRGFSVKVKDGTQPHHILEMLLFDSGLPIDSSLS